MESTYYFDITATTARKVNFYLGQDKVVPSTILRRNLASMTITDELDLVTLLQAVFQAMEDDEEFEKAQKFRQAIMMALDATPGISFRLGVVSNSNILYPKGAYLLDEEVVNRDLAWLSAYPKVATVFENALKNYIEADKNKYRDVVDGMRQTMELLLKELLGNKRSLENQKDALLKWLSDRNADQFITNLYNNLLFVHYTKYQNESVKHDRKDYYSEAEVEFVIYLTGTFMRYLLQLGTTS